LLDGMEKAVAGSRRKAELVGLLVALRRMQGWWNGGLGARRCVCMRSGAMRCGFVGGCGLGVGGGEDSYEFQLRRRWESALDELATLDFSGVRVRFGEALVGLDRIARETLFAPESRETSVQVMGPLEAAGESSMRCGFWVLGI